MIGKIVGGIMVLLSIVFAISLVVSGIGPSIEYSNKVRGYMDRASWSMEPDELAENIKMAKQGMYELGLTESDYGAYIFKTADWRMDTQFRKMDALIKRVEGIKGYCNGTIIVAQISGQDLCETKMQPIKSFIYDVNGWGDDIAEKAYYAKYHPVVGFWGALLNTLLFIVGLLLIGLA